MNVKLSQSSLYSILGIEMITLKSLPSGNSIFVFNLWSLNLALPPLSWSLLKYGLAQLYSSRPLGFFESRLPMENLSGWSTFWDIGLISFFWCCFNTGDCIYVSTFNVESLRFIPSLEILIFGAYDLLFFLRPPMLLFPTRIWLICGFFSKYAFRSFSSMKMKLPGDVS